MTSTSLVILNSGGIRSFVAAAAVLSGQHKPRTVFVYLKGDHANAHQRFGFVRRQADHLGVDEVLDIDLLNRRPTRPSADQPPSAVPLMPRAQLLINGLTQAMALGVEHLVWPVQANGDFDLAAQMTEQMVLVDHLAKLEQARVPKIDAPLLELSDKQLVELGCQLELPWQLTWSCLMPTEKPCRHCAGCRRRHDAFAAAGVVDPTVTGVAAVGGGR